MTNSYAIIRAIAKVDGMSYAEKFAGTMVALHLDRKKNQIAVKQELIANECGLTLRSVRGAVAKLIAAGIFTSRRTRDRLILIPAQTFEDHSVKESVYMDRNICSYLAGTTVPISNKKLLPLEYDLTFRTREEEENKRERERLSREMI